MKWIVISDIHFKNYKYDDYEFDAAKLRSSLEQTIRDLNQRLDFIIITGDCFYQNDASDDIAREMVNFIKRIGRFCGVQSGRIYICRGNHDIDRKNSRRNELVEEERKRKSIREDSLHALSTLGCENFRSLYNMVKGTKVPYKPFTAIAPRRLDVRIASIDTCLLSKDDNDTGQLRVCGPQLEEVGRHLKDDEKLNIAMMHHGIEQLHPNDARSFEYWLEDNHVDIIFSGHTHRAAVGYLDDVRRDIPQFTTGALVIDDYAIPSFYFCEGDSRKVTLFLYTFSKDTEQWELDGHHLRKFQRGRYSYTPSRQARLVETPHNPTEALSPVEASIVEGTAGGRLACEEVIRTLNQRYREKFGSSKIVSSKTEEQESFNAWKIVGSLAGIGVPYPVALMLACQVVDELVSDSYTSDNILNSTQIKGVIYDTILACKSYPEGTSRYEVGVWASEYARHYDKETGFVVVEGDRREQLSYTTLKDTLIREAVVQITGEAIYYDKIYHNEKIEMANAIMRFVKSLGIFEIRRDILLDLIAEFMSQRPHPWFVTRDREGIISYHLEHADMHLDKMTVDATDITPVLQIEVAYHVSAAILARYDEYTGCKESSPIVILYHALRMIDQQLGKGLPMVRYRIIQLQKDLQSSGVTMGDLRKSVNLVYRNLVQNRQVDRHDTAEALVELRLLAGRLETPAEAWAGSSEINTFASVVSLFNGAQGFKVKKPLQHFYRKAFFVEPSWTDEEKKAYRLGDDLLVCMLKDDSPREEKNGSSIYTPSRTMGLIEQYLEMDNKQSIREIVFVKEDVSNFMQDERDSVRNYLKAKGFTILCVFIQGRDFECVPEYGWRNELLRVIKKSRYSR